MKLIKKVVLPCMKENNIDCQTIVIHPPLSHLCPIIMIVCIIVIAEGEGDGTDSVCPFRIKYDFIVSNYVKVNYLHLDV